MIKTIIIGALAYLSQAEATIAQRLGQIQKGGNVATEGVAILAETATEASATAQRGSDSGLRYSGDYRRDVYGSVGSCTRACQGDSQCWEVSWQADRSLCFRFKKGAAYSYGNGNNWYSCWW